VLIWTKAYFSSVCTAIILVCVYVCLHYVSGWMVSSHSEEDWGISQLDHAKKLSIKSLIKQILFLQLTLYLPIANSAFRIYGLRIIIAVNSISSLNSVK
jgi:hypothetical protein